jgi:hypothetical protein
MLLAAILGLAAIAGISLINSGDFAHLANNYTGLPTGIWPWRILSLVFIPLAILAGYFVSVGAKFLSAGKRGKYFGAIFVVGIVLVGTPTTFLVANGKIGTVGGIGQEYDLAELGAMNWMRLNVPLNASILTSYPRGPMLAIASAKFNQPLENFSSGGIEQIVFQSKDPNQVLGLLSYYNISYIFVDQYDWSSINSFSNSFMAKYLLPMLPVVYNNSNNIVYAVDPSGPSLTAERSGSGIDLLSPLYTTDNYAIDSALLSYSTPYGTSTIGSEIPPNSTLAILPYDPSPTLDVNDSYLFTANNKTLGDSITTGSQYIVWSLGSTEPGAHVLKVSLSSFASLSDIRTFSFGLQSSVDPKLASMSCAVQGQNQTRLSTLSSFKPKNGTVIAAVTAHYGSQLKDLYINCQVPSGITSNRASLSISDLSFGTWEDSQNVSVPYLFSSTISKPADYLKWVEGGGKLLVLDPGLPLGYFGHAMGISEGPAIQANSVALGSDAYSINATAARIVTVPSTDSPFSSTFYSGTRTSLLLVEKSAGNGTIYWLQMGPILTLMRQHRISISMIHPDPPYAAGLSFYDALLKGTVALSGPSTISGSSAMSLVGKIPQNVTGSFGELQNFTIKNFIVRGNSTNWTVSSSSVVIRPSSFEPDMMTATYSGGATVRIMPENPLSPLIITGATANGILRNYTSYTGITMTASSLEKFVFSSSTVITLNGVLNSTFTLVSPQFYPKVSSPPYGYNLRSAYSSLVLGGNFTLTTANYMDGLVVTNISGNYHTVNTYATSVWEITPAGWFTLFKSVPNIALLGVIAGVASLDYMICRKRDRSSREEHEIEEEVSEEEEQRVEAPQMVSAPPIPAYAEKSEKGWVRNS